MPRPRRTSSAYFTVVPEKPKRPFPVGEIGSDLVVFLDGGTPAVIADCGSADPDSDVRSLRPGGKKLAADHLPGEGVPSIDLFFCRLGAVFVEDEDYFMICSSQPIETSNDVYWAYARSQFHLISGFERQGPGDKVPAKIERRRCPLGHGITVPPRRCPLHGQRPEPVPPG